MEKIESFKIDHLNLFPGLYVSRIDKFEKAVITTFDMRFTAPNRDAPLKVPAMHTLEHLGATFFRNSTIKEQIIYFGPMGCRTGFYLVLYNEWSSEKLLPHVLEFCDFVKSFVGDVPGATPVECGNYSEQDLDMAKIYAAAYSEQLTKNKRLAY